MFSTVKLVPSASKNLVPDGCLNMLFIAVTLGALTVP